jgi:hypothetical protein
MRQYILDLGVSIRPVSSYQPLANESERSRKEHDLLTIWYFASEVQV